MSNLLKSNQPCPDCGSSDGLAIYKGDKGTYCFSCKKSTGAGKETFKNDNKIISDKTLQELEFGGTLEAITHRGISKAAAERFGVKSLKDSSGKLQEVIYPSYKDGALVAQKYRSPTYPKGCWRGRTQEDGTKVSPGFFGQHLWDGGKSLTITEGEYDCLAFWDLMGNYPVVSIPDGSDSAVKTVQQESEWLQKFETVKICFDSDTAGVKAAEEVAKVLPNTRVEIVNLQHYKDVNDYLLNGKKNELKTEWFNAKLYQPAGLVGGSERFDDLFITSKSFYAPYPFRGLNKETLGLRTGEMVTIISGSGSGKTTVAAEVLNHLREQTDCNVGLMFLEESIKKTKLRLMSLDSNKNLEILEYIRELKKFERDNQGIKPEDNWLRQALEAKFPKMMADPEVLELADDVEYLRKIHDSTIGAKDSEGRDRFVMFDHFGSNDIETISGLIRAMAKTHGCKYVFLDHISILVSDQENGDERRALDEIATKLRTLVQNLDIGLIMVAHLKRPNGKPHEEGGQTSLADIRGTAGIGQLSDLVIGLERNGQADCSIERNITTIRVVKNRKFGSTGVACRLYYDPDTGRMREVDEDDIKMLVAESQGTFGDLADFDSSGDTSVFDNSKFGEFEKTPLQKDKTVVELMKLKGEETWGMQTSKLFQ
jgi:twinkle protein